MTARRKCPECGQDVRNIPNDNHISHQSLPGPGNIRGSNIDRVLDDHGRLLFIEEKRPNEQLPRGQVILLRNLAKVGTVWIVSGTTEQLTGWKVVDGRTTKIFTGNMDTYRRHVRQWFGR